MKDHAQYQIVFFFFLNNNHLIPTLIYGDIIISSFKGLLIGYSHFNSSLLTHVTFPLSIFPSSLCRLSLSQVLIDREIAAARAVITFIMRRHLNMPTFFLRIQLESKFCFEKGMVKEFRLSEFLL